MCCVTTDAGGAIVVTSAERARDLPRLPVHVLGSGEATGAAMASQMPDLTSSDAFRHAGAAAFADAGVAPSDIQHAMLYDATAHLPLMALEDVGLVPRGESGAFVADGNTAIGGSLPVNTSGGGLNYTHSGMYGMYTLQESIRQLRGEAAAQVDGHHHLAHPRHRRHVPVRRHRHPVHRATLTLPPKFSGSGTSDVPVTQLGDAWTMELNELTARLQRVEDELAIRHVILSYGPAADAGRDRAGRCAVGRRRRIRLGPPIPRSRGPTRSTRCCGSEGTSR